jgi:hypothetical protein
MLPQGEVTEEPLDGMDRDSTVQLGAVAHALAGVIADAAEHSRKGVVRDELPPGFLVAAPTGERQPRLYVLARRTPGVARREKVHVQRTALTDCAGLCSPIDKIGQRRDVEQFTAHGPSITCSHPTLIPLRT